MLTSGCLRLRIEHDQSWANVPSGHAIKSIPLCLVEVFWLSLVLG